MEPLLLSCRGCREEKRRREEKKRSWRRGCGILDWHRWRRRRWPPRLPLLLLAALQRRERKKGSNES
jgi:hypothetical protein